MNDARPINSWSAVGKFAPVAFTAAFAGTAAVGFAYATLFRLSIARTLDAAGAVAASCTVMVVLLMRARSTDQSPKIYAKRVLLAAEVGLLLCGISGGIGLKSLGVLDVPGLVFYTLAIAICAVGTGAVVYHRTLTRASRAVNPSAG